MKIILQPEARTISNLELADNQRYLIDLLDKISPFRFGLRKKRSKINIT